MDPKRKLPCVNQPSGRDLANLAVKDASVSCNGGSTALWAVKLAGWYVLAEWMRCRVITWEAL